MRANKMIDKGKLVYQKGNWKIYEPGPKTKKVLERAKKRIESGKAEYKKLDL